MIYVCSDLWTGGQTHPKDGEAKLEFDKSITLMVVLHLWEAQLQGK